MDKKSASNYVKCIGIENDPSMSQSFTLDRIDKIKHYIRIKVHNIIVLRFWDKTLYNI